MKDRLVYAAYRTGSAFVGALPEPVIRWGGSLIGRLAWTWADSRKTMARRHMARVLGDGAPAERAARRVFAAYGRYWAEVFWYRPRRFAQVEEKVQIDGLDHLRQAVAAGRPVILTLPHLGNWEMAATAAERAGVRITAVAESLGNPLITEWFLRVRKKLAIDIVLTGQGGSATRKLIEALRAGQTVALLSDRDLTGRGVEVEFFGERTTLPAGPAALAVRTGAAIIPVACYFQDGAGHHAVIEPELEVPIEGSTEERVKETTQRLAGILELQIRRHPEQWHLVQPNWPSDRELLIQVGP